MRRQAPLLAMTATSRSRLRAPSRPGKRKRARKTGARKVASAPSRGNRRRSARPSQTSAAGRAPAAGRSRGGVGLPPLVRRAGRLAVRLGLAGAVTYALLLGVERGYDHALTTPRFEARVLEFSPTPHVDGDRLRALMGLRPGTNLLAVDIDELARAVVADPWIASARVVRRLPDTLMVDVTEHEPVAVLLAGKFFLVDAKGRPFKEMEPGERGRLPIITGIGAWDLVRNTVGAGRRMDRALAVLRAYQAGPRPDLGEIHVEPDGAVTLYTARRGTQLDLGRGDPEVALARYDALRKSLGLRSEALAAVHLDAQPAQGEETWLVASFFRDEAPSVPGPKAPPRVQAGAQAHSEQPGDDARPRRHDWRRDGPRIPRPDAHSM